tara:strand:+ start:197 stop:2185 length:1989 start_codon:yes stop_codon:yes gene_type:complete
MEVTIVKSAKGYGEILQKIQLDPNKRYRLTADIKSDKSGLAFLQIKRYANSKELDRNSTGRSKGAEWTTVEKTFDTNNVDYVEILLRWNQKEEAVGSSLAFQNVSVVEIPPLAHNGEEVGPRAVPTFNSIGLYWKPTGGTASRSVTTEYRKKGESDWNEALPLWFDATEHPGGAAKHTAEYRGSIVYLDAGTTYEVRLKLQEGPERVFDVTTWDEDFKIARTVTLPKSQSEMYTITEGGNETDGYVLYEAEPGTEWDIDNKAAANIKIEAPWVIVRGLTMKGGKNHGIVLGDVNHIVIEDCDISNWGETRESGQAKNLNSAIYSGSKKLHNVVIQNCEMHHPRSDSNSWNQKRPGTKSKHPEGPQAISFRGGKGLYVIRNNRIYSDMEHMFNDAMGEYANFSFGGFPNRDTDIYNNYVSHCWDDGLEIEGANMNVRVWNNYIDMTYGAIGGATTSLGPVYYFRNIYGVSRKHEGTEPNDYRGHYLLKLGNPKLTYTQGKIFLMHNTTLQPPAFEGYHEPSSGAQSGLAFTNKSYHQENITSRNNILQLRKDSDWAIKDVQETATSDYDYDLYIGRVKARPGSEENGINAAPIYERAPDGRLWPAPGTPGYDDAERIPNFNDDFAGSGPDRGAVETNSKEPKPETWPIFPENYSPPAESPTES